MASLSSLAMKRGLMLGLAGLLAPALAGCVAMPLHTWGHHAPAPKICQVVMAWQNTVSLAPDPLNGGRTQPVLAARMYLFGPKIDHPMVAQGGFKVELFDETHGQSVGPAMEEWVFKPQDMPNLMKKDFLGIGYTVLLPWGTYRPDVMKIRMKTAYLPPDSLPIYTENIVTLDLGNGIITDVTGKMPAMSFKR